MTNLKAIIVDEERLARVNLRRLLEPFTEITIIGEASSCESALELINLKNPQLIFLDIQLHGETCYDLLGLIDNSIYVIFVTAFDQNTIHTFNMNSVGYLSKPVNPEQLKIAIERVKESGNYPKIETYSYEYSDGISVPQNILTS
jgi:two-component system LytT family response regulator